MALTLRSSAALDSANRFATIPSRASAAVLQVGLESAAAEEVWCLEAVDWLMPGT